MTLTISEYSAFGEKMTNNSQPWADPECDGGSTDPPSPPPPWKITIGLGFP